MPDFSHLEALEVARGATAELELYEISTADEMEKDACPILIGKVAGPSNRRFHQASLEASTKALNRRRGALKLTPKAVTEQGQRDRELYAKYVLTGWRNINDRAGNPVPFNASNALDFLNALPDRFWPIVRDFFSDEENFTTDDRLTRAEAAEAGNGSEKG